MATRPPILYCLSQSVKQLFFYMLAFAGLVSQTHAVMIGTDTVAAEVASDLGREEIKSLLTRQDVSDKLTSLGVDIADVSDRVEAMSDADVVGLNRQMADLYVPVGYRRLLTVAPDFAPAYNNLAQLLSELGEHTEAIVMAEQAVALGGPHASLYQKTLDALRE